jgi:sugar lactone lactonase YvrE
MLHDGETMAQSLSRCGLPFALTLVSVVSVYAAQPITEITLPGSRLFTESITSTKDGTLYAGSVGKGNVVRIPYGSTTVTEFIKPGSNGLNAVFGIYADEKHKTLWVCSDHWSDGKGDPPAVKTFDLTTGDAKGSYTLPGTPTFCNDIAVADNGTAYISDTEQGSLVVLKPGAKELEVFAKDPLLKGIDGLAFGEKTVLYVNSVTENKMLRVDIGPNGKSKDIIELKLSQPITAPDGMRTIGKDRLLMAENSGNMDIVTITGLNFQNADIKVIKSGLESTPAVTATRGMAWIAEGKLNYQDDPKLKDKNPDPFKLYAVPLPKK